MPSPIHGSSIVGKHIYNSLLINKSFETSYINLGTSNSIHEIGNNFYVKIARYLNIIFKTLKQLITNKPNVVYVAITAKGIGFYKDAVIVFIAKLFGVKLVFHFHNKGVSLNQDKFIDNILYKLVFKNTKTILLSKLLYCDIKKYVNETSVYYCPNGIPILNATYKNDTVEKGKTQLLFLSNLLESKGVFVLLNALKKLKDRSVDFQCSFVGCEGDISTSTFNKKVNSLNLVKQVSYLGSKYEEDKIAILNNVDIFIHPTFSDCFPLVLLEASQFELAIVSTYEGAIPEIIEDGVNGCLVKQKDIDTLASKLEFLIKNPIARKKMGSNAYKKYIASYTLNVFEKNMCTILKSVLNSK